MATATLLQHMLTCCQHTAGNNKGLQNSLSDSSERLQSLTTLFRKWMVECTSIWALHSCIRSLKNMASFHSWSVSS